MNIMLLYYLFVLFGAKIKNTQQNKKNRFNKKQLNKIEEVQSLHSIKMNLSNGHDRRLAYTSVSRLKRLVCVTTRRELV